MKQKRLQIKETQINDSESESGIFTFSGYASTFGNVDSYGDTVMKGAFTETILPKDRFIKLRYNHWSGVIGKWLSFKEDDHGLLVEGELTPNHSLANDVKALLIHRAIDGLSIGYHELEAVKNKHGGKDLHVVDLEEISIVEEQAEITATIDNMKSHIEGLTTMKQIESFMRDAMRLSPLAAKALISRIKNGQRDVDVIDCSKLVTEKDLVQIYLSREITA